MHQDLQLVAERCILLGLKLAGIVDGNVEEMVDQRIGALFMPHGESPFLTSCHTICPMIYIWCLLGVTVFHTQDFILSMYVLARQVWQGSTCAIIARHRARPSVGHRHA